MHKPQECHFILGIGAQPCPAALPPLSGPPCRPLTRPTQFAAGPTLRISPWAWRQGGELGLGVLSQVLCKSQGLSPSGGLTLSLACEVRAGGPAFGHLELGQVRVAAVGCKWLGALSLNDCGGPGVHPVTPSSRGPFLSKQVHGGARRGQGRLLPVAPSSWSCSWAPVCCLGRRSRQRPQLSWLGGATLLRVSLDQLVAFVGTGTQKRSFVQRPHAASVPTCPFRPCLPSVVASSEPVS